MTEAFRLAKVAVKARIEAKGERISNHTAREITAEAFDYLRQHPELMWVAQATVLAEEG